MTFHIIIPARYNSTRLPRKLLLDLNGQTVLERVYRQAQKTAAASITIATDHPLIMDAALGFGAPVILTKACHLSGTERLAEAVEILNLPPQACVVNVQGDEPFIPPELITQVAKSLTETSAPMATLCWPITENNLYQDPNIVKVVRDCHQHALYFSRSWIPFNRDGLAHIVYRHIGLYAYRVSFLSELQTLPACELEAVEALEQLRVLWNGYKIHVALACVAPLQDINTAEDFSAAKELLMALPE